MRICRLVERIPGVILKDVASVEGVQWHVPMGARVVECVPRVEQLLTVQVHHRRLQLVFVSRDLVDVLHERSIKVLRCTAYLSRAGEEGAERDVAPSIETGLLMASCVDSSRTRHVSVERFTQRNQMELKQHR